MFFIVLNGCGLWTLIKVSFYLAYSQSQNRLDGCIVWNAHNTILSSKRLPICTCHLTQCRQRWFLPPYRTKWHFDPSSHLATVVNGRKLGGCCAPYGGAGFPSNTMGSSAWSTSILNGILIHPAIWPQYTWAKKWGAAEPAVINCLNLDSHKLDSHN